MILIALGSNRAGPWGPPVATLERALDALADAGVQITARSRWFRSAPFGYLHQPDFVNGIVAVRTTLAPRAVLRVCHDVERAAGRRRHMRWGPRTLDLDLLVYDRRIIGAESRAEGLGLHGRTPLRVPHPGIAQRAFVLVPLHDVAPLWRHPVSGLTAREMLDRLPAEARRGIYGPIARCGEATVKRQKSL